MSSQEFSLSVGSFLHVCFHAYFHADAGNCVQKYSVCKGLKSFFDQRFELIVRLTRCQVTLLRLMLLCVRNTHIQEPYFGNKRLLGTGRRIHEFTSGSHIFLLGVTGVLSV